MKKLLLLGSFAMALISGVAFSNPVFDDAVQKDDQIATANYQHLFNRSSQTGEIYTKLFGNNEGSMMRVNLSCGIAPLPPLGCRVGSCVCDQYGRNCQWTFVCR